MENGGIAADNEGEAPKPFDPVSDADRQFVVQVAGTFLYNKAQAVDMDCIALKVKKWAGLDAVLSFEASKCCRS